MFSSATFVLSEFYKCCRVKDRLLVSRLSCTTVHDTQCTQYAKRTDEQSDLVSVLWNQNKKLQEDQQTKRE